VACGHSSSGAPAREPLAASTPPVASAPPVVTNPDPFANLTLVEQREMAAYGVRLAAFADAGDKWWQRDADSLRLFGLDRPEPERSFKGLNALVADQYAFGLALKAHQSVLIATSLTDESERFRVPLAEPTSPKRKQMMLATSSSVSSVSASATELAVVLYRDTTDLLVLDRASGAELWQTRWWGTSAERPALDQGIVYLRTGEGYEARDARRGERVWLVPASFGLTPAFGPRLLGNVLGASLRPGELTLLEKRNGQERCSVPVATPPNDGLIVGKALVLASTLADRPGSIRYAGFDPETCRRLWTSVAIETGNGAQQWALGDHLLVVSEQQALIFDEHGALIWHYGLPGGQPLAFDEHDGVPRLALTNPAFTAPNLIGVFRPDAAPAPAEHLTVRGSVRWDDEPAADVRVVAYGVATRTDSAGRYELLLTARGNVTVSVPSYAAAMPLPLTGQHEYTLDISGESECESCE
jgi:hypothetical protein